MTVASFLLFVIAGTPAAVILLGLLVVLARKRRGPTAPPLVTYGAPVIGNLLEFALGQEGPLSFIKKSMAAVGPVFSVHIGHKTLTFLIGPEPSRPFFQSKDDVFSQNEVYGFMTAVFGKDVVYDAPPAKRKAQMQHMSNGLRKDRLTSYVPKIVRETEAYLEEHMPGDAGEVDILKALSELTILTASRCLHGDDVREHLYKEVSQLYHDLDKGITPLSFFWPNAPIAGHAQRDAAREQMGKLFADVIAARRNRSAEAAAEATDILQVFIDMKYKDGTSATSDEVTGLLIALLFAGQHTSSVTSTWTTMLIANDGALLRRVLQEQTAVLGSNGGGSELTFDQVNQMELLHNCVKEALRMYPPLIMLMRQAMKDVAVTSDDGEYNVWIFLCDAALWSFRHKTSSS
jgi:sterol 14-demethylase